VEGMHEVVNIVHVSKQEVTVPVYELI